MVMSHWTYLCLYAAWSFHGCQQFFVSGKHGRSVKHITHCRLLTGLGLCGVFLHAPLVLNGMFVMIVTADQFINVSAIGAQKGPVFLGNLKINVNISLKAIL